MEMIDLNNLVVITDFDHTLTSFDSESTWGILDSKEVLPKDCIKKCEEFKNYYLPIENNFDLSFDIKNKLMNDWYTNHLNLFIKYKLNEKVLNDITSNKYCLKFRKSADRFLKFTYKNNIPVIIISAGISNVIENYLKANDCLFDNIYIISNIIKFKDGIIKGFRNNIIHSLNKDKIIYPVNVKNIFLNKKNILLIGDNISDISMIPKEYKDSALKIAFLNDYSNCYEVYKKNFDIVYNADSSFDNIINMLKKVTH